MAILTTSNGVSTMVCALSENITTMVNSSARSETLPITFMNLLSYRSSPILGLTR
jgi:hypothetical protein